MKKTFISVLLAALMVTAGCGQNQTSNSVTEVETESTASSAEVEADMPNLTAQFGAGGETFTMHLYDNETARQLVRYVGNESWNLPIYHYNDFEGSDVMQYYDVASRYEFTAEPESITSEKAGEVYYSEPNRIVLFYKDANVSGEYTKIGYFDYSEEFVTAVEENPVLEGWGNKIIVIKREEQ